MASLVNQIFVTLANQIFVTQKSMNVVRILTMGSSRPWQAWHVI
jgi:hypothetical protein